MSFNVPAWLLLLLFLPLLFVVKQGGTRQNRLLHGVFLALLILALADPQLVLPHTGGNLVVVVDRSRSMPPPQQAEALIQHLQQGMGENMRYSVVSVGAHAVLEQPAGSGPFGGFHKEVDGNGSDLGQGLRLALDLVPRGAGGRILLLSDGAWTGVSPEALIGLANARGVPIDFRFLGGDSGPDLAVDRLWAPVRVVPGQGYFLHATIQVPSPQTVHFQLLRGGQILKEGAQVLDAGMQRLRFRDLAPVSGVLPYQLRIWSEVPDVRPQNNQAKLLVQVLGRRPLLLVSQSGQSQWAQQLTDAGLTVMSRAPHQVEWDLGLLSGVGAVLLENVAANDLGLEAMKLLRFWVENGGGGLMFTGGPAAYGQGGYYQSPLEDIMPVSMDLRQEHRKLSLGLVVALDRSGSMAVQVPDGRSKMDLANMAALGAVRLLGENDAFGALAVDSEAHVVREMAPVGDLDVAIGRLLNVAPGGGGIYVYNALVAAVDMLNDVDSGVRHIILFADADDAEQPGDYTRLLGLCRQVGITVSVVALGNDQNSDAAFLKDVALRGGGRILFSEDPYDLPRLFAQDTFVAARNAYLTEPAAVVWHGEMTALLGMNLTAQAQSSGYNLTYARPDIQLAASLDDEYGSPLVAAWHRGTGRVVCLTADVSTVKAASFLAVPETAVMLAGLAGWVLGDPSGLPPGTGMTQELNNGLLQVRFHLDPEREGLPFSQMPEIQMLHFRGNAQAPVQRHRLQWESPDVLMFQTALTAPDTVLPRIDLGSLGQHNLAPLQLPYSPEFRPAAGTDGRIVLERLARATGGKERIQLASIWNDFPQVRRLATIRTWVFLGALLCLMIEVVLRRTGTMLRISGSFPKRFKARTAPQTPSTAQGRVPARKPADQPAVLAPQDLPEGGLVDAFARTKRKLDARGWNKGADGPREEP